MAPPAFVPAEVEPFTQDEVEALLNVAEYCEEATTRGRQRFVMRRRTTLRDRAIILVLLDTGLHATELYSLNIGDLDEQSGKLTVKHGYGGGAKGGKGRLVYLGRSARRALWRYTVSREDKDQEDAPLFAAGNRRMGRDTLRQLIVHLGEAAVIKKCHPHRFRHTLAITYLPSAGDVFTLQRLLGHSSLDMVQHYARVAQTDVERAHPRASSADNWHL